MENTKKSITYKVIAGYVMITALAVFAVWFIYGQIVRVSDNARSNALSNQKLFLVSEVATNLYNLESTSRDILQNQNSEALPKLQSQIDTISAVIDSLRVLSEEQTMRQELDSLLFYLNQKSENTQEILNLRKEGTTDSYYAKVISRLQKIDDAFEDDDYETQLRDLDPATRNAILGFIEFSEEERANRLTQRSADSLVNSLKLVLNDLERQERRMLFTINEKENELLENDQIISNRLRNLRAEIEQEEIKKSVAQVSTSQELLQQTSLIIGVAGVVSIVTIIVFLVLITKDTNRSQKYRKELEDSKNFAESLLKNKEQIMATVTHDMRSPLNTVIGYSDLLQKTTLDNQQQHYLTHLRNSSEYILRLINDLLDLSKLEAGKIQIEHLRFSLKNIVEESIKNTVPEPDTKKLAVVTHLDDSLANELISDPFRLQQILTNLLSNAYKFTKKGGITIEGTLLEKADDYFLEMCITDTGIGISKELQKQIFEEFSQANSTIEKHYGGYGLGLSITKRLVNLLGGEVRLESEVGEGTSVRFSIPVQLAPITEKAETPVQPSVVHFSNDQKVLIVDDEPTQLALTREVVKSVGLSFSACSSVKEALQLVEADRYDLILTDIQMPEHDGFDFIKQLKSAANTAEIPVIALSGKADVTAETYREKGFYDNLLKPYKATELIALMGEVLDVKAETTMQSEAILQNASQLFDVTEVGLFAQGDRDSLRAILNSFLQNTADNQNVLEQHVDKRDQKGAAFVAHKMLPMFRQLKIEMCIPALEAFEEERIPQDKMLEQWQGLQQNITAAKQAIEQYIKG